MDEPTPSSGRQKRPRVAEEKRKRAVRACDWCRRVKEKCEGGVPCRRCSRYQRQCVFNTLPDHGDRASRASVDRSLELTASLSRDDVTEAQRVRYMEEILAHYVPNISFDIQSLKRFAEDLQLQHRGSDKDGPATQVELDELEDLAIDDEDFTIKALPDNTTQYSGEFSYLNFSMKIRRKIDEWMQTSAPDDTPETDHFEETWRSTQLQSGSALVSASITCLPPRYVADFLVQTFFKYAQTNNFYVEEDWLCEKVNTCYTNPAVLSSKDAGSVCAILMVLAIGTQFAHMDSPKQVNKVVDPNSADDHRFSEDEVGLTFYKFASKLLPDIITTASVRSVQACLLIGTYLLPLDTSGLSYTYYGLALKMAIQNGMHRKYTGPGLDSRMVEVRNRVFWTAYTIEKRISILHGRPSSMSQEDVDAEFPVDLPSLRPSGQLSNYTNMVALIKLTLRLADIANEISSLRRCRKGQQSDCLDKLLTRRRQLMEWWATLPEETYCRDLNPLSGHFRSNVHLRLDYCLTRIFIGRPFLFSNMKGINRVITTGSQQKTQTARSKGRSTLVTDCVEAALEIIDLCRLLRDETGLARASYTEFSSCRAALLVILAQSLTKRTDRLRNALETGMGLIKIMSMGVGSARSAVNVIEALERAIRRLDSWDQMQRQSNEAADSGYERFKNWEMLWKTGPLSPAISAAAIHGQVPNDTVRATSGPELSSVLGVGINTPSHANEDPKDPHATEFSVSPPSRSMPTFAFEGFVSNFPQELGEFNAIPCFEGDTQQGLGSDLDHPSTADTRWMQFMND
ncbi:transcriptional regulator family: Fungal Specific TF [Paecilomyces variotii]|uniref:Putative C6 transcription factor n=1 Tax=Byssochlamys spectabilis TaxID=264951 RepID=A0A443HSF8_BYSSP|nr:putative C6 transcription factor [Paecilomyces variotii]KAJ9212789.1 transcriptional regulator family: Fungal Specific TF [Paecilomyces variotii]KAJ9223008.1 transcriptional regulator family: Fungal Specific TF [Paecilomyces variotii]KAJ9232731.1 transcriptional regulator family: Fungal Specific TF [Paecilomyces variotii]KAJ9265075.1 transcriptional regulator family: Fungal Specific TF [Paecilomyces variotii]KAJ9303368.1 transcriptional regulator family: Fungal Specific TF [Paecilomyces var